VVHAGPAAQPGHALCAEAVQLKLLCWRIRKLVAASGTKPTQKLAGNPG
jgi:hypothetical protein